MAVGDSFFVEANGADTIRVRCKLLNAARHYRPAKFTTRLENGGVRIWRAA